MSLRYKKVECPFCDGRGIRNDVGGLKECPACEGNCHILVGNDNNFYARKGGVIKGTWGQQYASLDEQGVPDA